MADKIEGHAAVYSKLSQDLGGFREQIAPGAFRSILGSKPDVMCLVNHSTDQLLGRTASGTCELDEDEEGLRYRCSMPDTSTGRDALELIRRGDLRGSSFSFSVDSDEWEEVADPDDEQNTIIRRTIISFRSLVDVSPVASPAYLQTSVKAL